MARDRRSRSAQLLDQVLASGEMSIDYLSTELRMSPALLECIRRGERTMPWERQLYFAVLVSRRLPELDREARRLREQAAAALSMQRRETVCHDQPPEGHRYWIWP